MTRQGTMTTREPFYMKNIKVNKSGKVDFIIINDERSIIQQVKIATLKFHQY